MSDRRKKAVGTSAPALVVQQTQPLIDKAKDTQIKSFADIDDKRLQGLYQRTLAMGFSGTVSSKFERVGFPGGDYPLATITFRSFTGFEETYDLGLFLAYPEITWAEMRRVGILPTVGNNATK